MMGLDRPGLQAGRAGAVSQRPRPARRHSAARC